LDGLSSLERVDRLDVDPLPNEVEVQKNAVACQHVPGIASTTRALLVWRSVANSAGVGASLPSVWSLTSGNRFSAGTRTPSRPISTSQTARSGALPIMTVAS
jgi:hypothetical protein